MLRVHEIAQGDEGRAAIRSVGCAFPERSPRNARFTPVEYLVGLDVPALSVQICTALDEVIGAARREHGETRRYTRYEYDALAHPSKDNDGLGVKLAQH